jgi:hypothetical protein
MKLKALNKPSTSLKAAKNHHLYNFVGINSQVLCERVKGSSLESLVSNDSADSAKELKIESTEFFSDWRKTINFFRRFYHLRKKFRILFQKPIFVRRGKNELKIFFPVSVSNGLKKRTILTKNDDNLKCLRLLSSTKNILKKVK